MSTALVLLVGLAALVALGRCITTEIARDWWGQPTDDSQGTERK